MLAAETRGQFIGRLVGGAVVFPQRNVNRFGRRADKLELVRQHVLETVEDVEVQRIADRNHQPGFRFRDRHDLEALRHVRRHHLMTFSESAIWARSTKSIAECAASARVTSSCVTTPCSMSVSTIVSSFFFSARARSICDGVTRLDSRRMSRM
jgi:hypothetical protein